MPGGFAAGLAGLSAMEEGYERGAESYWKRRELESTSAYGAGLRQLLEDQMAQQSSGGMALPGAVQPPTMPSMGPPAGAGAGPPGGSVATPGPVPLSPAVPPAAPPSMVNGPPGGFVNPLRVGGQPQNLTGGGPGPNGIIPPGGTGVPPGAPAASTGLPQPPAGARPVGPPGPGGPGMFPQGMRPQATWMDIGKAILKANPNIPDDQLAFAISKAMPLMNTQSQAEWRNVELLIQQERLEEARATREQRGATAAAAEEGRRLRADLQAQTRLLTEQGRMDRANLSARTKTDIANLNAATRKELAELSEAGKEERAERLADLREKLQGLSIEARKEIAAALEQGKSLRLDITQDRIDQRQQNREGALDRRQERQIGAAEERQQRQIGAAAERQQTAIAAKDMPMIRNTREAVREIDESIADIRESQGGGDAVTGLQGRINRWKEWAEGLIGDNTDSPTRASVYETRIRALQTQIPRLLAGVGRISTEERAHIDDIVRSLGTFTDPQVALNSLEELKKILLSKAPRDLGVGPTRQTDGPPPSSSGRGGRSSQQPSQQPPTLMDDLQEGEYGTYTAPDGSEHTWTIKNGAPVEVRTQGALPSVPGNVRVPRPGGGGASVSPF